MARIILDVIKQLPESPALLAYRQLVEIDITELNGAVLVAHLEARQTAWGQLSDDERAAIRAYAEA